MDTDQKRVVITGFGVVSCLGVGKETFWERVRAGQCGIDRISKYDPAPFRSQIAGEVRELDITDYMSAKESKRLDPFCHYAVAAGDEAVNQADLSDGQTDPDRIGVMLGSGIGGIRTLNNQGQILHSRGPAKSSPLMVPMMIIDMASGILAIRHAYTGPNIGMVTACASGTHAIGEAMWMIKRGDADAMVTGGAEAIIDPLGLTGFCAMKALSEQNENPATASRPFDANRDGFVPGEGAGVFVLESLDNARRRGANILAEIIGYGLTGDAYHITAPQPEGDGAAKAMTKALEHAGIGTSEVDYINAHGTSTQLNDSMETLAIKKALGEEHAYSTPISSTKSMVGHTIGAAGGIETVACMLAMEHGILPPTINYEEPDPECDLDYVPNEARQAPVDVCMNLNFGFGGHNGALVLRNWNNATL